MPDVLGVEAGVDGLVCLEKTPKLTAGQSQADVDQNFCWQITQRLSLSVLDVLIILFVSLGVVEIVVGHGVKGVFCE